ncbi:MAG TPA: cyclopropane-fatty-acyl-phospholipid synthase family protein [Candidatus Sulfotelmatobacter sp.]|nr:cyclopropane-fatty-acyl-phospholipid synthase family protein [Candidatus Sulfotelmatobacter sp.]
MTTDEHRLSTLTGAPMPAYPTTRRVRRLTELGTRLRAGTLTLILPDGEQMVFRGSEPGVEAEFHVRRARVMRRFLLGGHLAFGEAYVDGDWDSPDVAALLVYFLQNEPHFGLEGSWWLRLVQRALHRLRDNSRRRARDNIAAHYDLGNAFYAAWLDPGMTYSAALFAGPDDDLEAAQRNKYRRMAEIADIRPGHRVLEIGCGWGGFAQYAAEQGASVVGITLSQAQLDYARERIGRAGLADRVELRLQDYRDVTGTFDRVVSIEMLEAVGETYWPVYFDTLRALTAPGGRIALQAITIDDARWAIYRSSPDFIQRYVFPGGMLPTPSHLRREVARVGLRWLADDGFGADYARTLKLWCARFERVWPGIAVLGFDARFRRLWRYYLSYCEAGFGFGSIDVRQIALARD